MKMQIIGKGIPDRKHFTMFITQRATDKAKEIHCINCGRVMLEITGDVRLVIDEQIKLDDVEREGKPTIVLCKRCKSKVTVI